MSADQARGRRRIDRPEVPRNPINSSCEYVEFDGQWLIFLASSDNPASRILIARAPTRALAVHWACEWCHFAEQVVAVRALDGLLAGEER